MQFKFRDRVRVVSQPSKIVRPDGHVSQGEFFEGAEGTVIRHDPQKEGYLLVMDCPELSALMGENITASFREYELELVHSVKEQREKDEEARKQVGTARPYTVPGGTLTTNGPYFIPANTGENIVPFLTKEQRLKRKARGLEGKADA